MKCLRVGPAVLHGDLVHVDVLVQVLEVRREERLTHRHTQAGTQRSGQWCSAMVQCDVGNGRLRGTVESRCGPIDATCQKSQPGQFTSRVWAQLRMLSIYVQEDIHTCRTFSAKLAGSTLIMILKMVAVPRGGLTTIVRSVVPG